MSSSIYNYCKHALCPEIASGKYRNHCEMKEQIQTIQEERNALGIAVTAVAVGAILTFNKIWAEGDYEYKDGLSESLIIAMTPLAGIVTSRLYRDVGALISMITQKENSSRQ